MDFPIRLVDDDARNEIIHALVGAPRIQTLFPLGESAHAADLRCHEQFYITKFIIFNEAAFVREVDTFR